MRLVLGLAVVAVAAGAESNRAATLNAVSFSPRSGGIEIALKLDRPVQHRYQRLKNPDRLYIDLLSTHARLPDNTGQAREIGQGLQIRIAERPNDTTRVVLDLRSPWRYSIKTVQDPPALLITLQPQKTLQIARRVTPAAAPEPVRIAEPPPVLIADGGSELGQLKPQPVYPTLPGPTAIPAPAPVASPIASSSGEAASPIRREAPVIVPLSVRASGRSFMIQRAASPPRLEALLKEPVPPGVQVSDFRQLNPGDGTPASVATTAYLSYDDENFYVVFVCKDEPAKIRARMSRRDDIGEDDSVSLYLDTFHDGQHAYKFTVNPLGIQSDALLAEGQSEDTRFDTQWRSDGRLTSDGYVALIEIPFRNLRFSSQASQTWGIALSRGVLRNNESDFWPYVSRAQSFIQQLGEVDGLNDIPRGHNVQFIPYGAFTNAKLLDPTIPRYGIQNEFRGGVDSKIVFHNSLTLDTTINPDFSQVESDDPQVTVNQRYEVFFPEKRPFFLDNIGFFATPINLLFTRRIIDPEFGARLTGKIGKWDLGLLGIDDRAPGKLVGQDSTLHDDHAVIGAVRIQREFGRNSSIGVLATDREFGQSASRLASLDTHLQLSPKWAFSGQLARSDDRSYDSTGSIKKLEGAAALADLSYTGQNFKNTIDFQDYTAGFRAPLGFIKRTDIRRVSESASYLFRPEDSRISDFGPFVSAGADWDHTGLLQDWFALAGFQMDFAGPLGFDVSRSNTFERYAGQGFHYGTTNADVYINAMKKLTFYGSLHVGEGINYNPGAALQPYKGTSQNYGGGFVWRPAKRIRLEQYDYYTVLKAPASIARTGPATAFTNNLMRTKFNIQFTRTLSFRGILDYNGLLPNPSLYYSDRFKTLTGDVLLTFLLSPGTALYLGYNNTYANLGIDPEAPPQLQRFGPPDYLTSRQIFGKLSYRFHF